VKLQEELHKKIELLSKYMKGGSSTQQSVMETVSSQPDLLKEDLKKLKKENMTYQETINRLVDHILT
jgi:ferritin